MAQITEVRAAVCFLPHCCTLSWSSEKRMAFFFPFFFLFFFCFKEDGTSRKHKQVEVVKEKERNKKQILRKTHEPEYKLK